MKNILVVLGLLACGFLLVSCSGNTASTPKSGTSPEGKEVPIETAALDLMTDTGEGKYSLVGTAELKTWLIYSN